MAKEKRSPPTSPFRNENAMKIQTIIKEELQRLLNEGRLEDIIAKYPEWENEIQEMAKEDPSGNLKYLAWQMKQLGKGFHIYDVMNYINRFHLLSKKDAISPKDINSYEDFWDLEKAVEAVEEKESETQLRKKAKSGANKVYDDEWFSIIHPKTKESACFYGKGTEWCITMLTDDHFNNYRNAASDFLFLIDKDKQRKVALQFKPWTAETLYELDDSEVELQLPHICLLYTSPSPRDRS